MGVPSQIFCVQVVAKQRPVYRSIGRAGALPVKPITAGKLYVPRFAFDAGHGVATSTPVRQLPFLPRKSLHTFD